MRIDVTNKEIINTKEICLHDGHFDGMILNCKKREIKFTARNVYTDNIGEKIDCELKFKNVIGYDMISCNFWCESPCIFTFALLEGESCELIEKYFEGKNLNNYKYSNIKSKKDYFETLIEFISGDRLRIACEYIIYEEHVTIKN